MKRRSSRKIVVVGAGGHAKVIVDILSSVGVWEIVGVTGTDPAPRDLLGFPVLGRDDDVLPVLRRGGVGFAFVAIGENARRLEIAKALKELGYSFPNAIAPSAFVSPNAELGQGIAVMPRAAINAAARIGDFAIVNTAASIDHDCVIAEGAHIGPGAVLAGVVRVGARAFVGAGAVVIPRLEIGADAVVGAGAAVTRSVPKGKVAVGVPARLRKRRQA